MSSEPKVSTTSLRSFCWTPGLVARQYSIQLSVQDVQRSNNGQLLKYINSCVQGPLFIYTCITEHTMMFLTQYKIILCSTSIFYSTKVKQPNMAMQKFIMHSRTNSQPIPRPPHPASFVAYSRTKARCGSLGTWLVHYVGIISESQNHTDFQLQSLHNILPQPLYGHVITVCHLLNCFDTILSFLNPQNIQQIVQDFGWDNDPKKSVEDSGPMKTDHQLGDQDACTTNKILILYSLRLTVKPFLTSPVLVAPTGSTTRGGLTGSRTRCNLKTG